MMDHTWILVANASVATIYRLQTSASPKQKPQLIVIEQFQHPESRQKDQDLVSDRMGDYQSKSGSGRGSFVERTDPHQYQVEVFARELTQALEKGRTSNQFQALILVAGPHFMGLIRKCMDDHPLSRLPITEVVKEYTNQTPLELLSLLKLDH